MRKWTTVGMPAAMCAVLVLAGGASADTLNVPGDFATIQAAINASAAGDEILVAPGTYAENISLPSRTLTLRGAGGAGVTFIDGSAANTVILLHSGSTFNTLIEGFTITNGRGNFSGGVSLNFASNATFRDCVFTANERTSNQGGAMRLATGCGVRLFGCTFSGNTAPFGAMGFAMGGDAGSVLIDGCVFEDHAGTAAAIGADAIVRDTVFRNNSGGSIGGGANVSGSARFYRCSFIDNSSTADGGGVGVSTTQAVTFDRCLFIGNSASSQGGAIRVSGGGVSLTSSVIIGNTASFGAGIEHFGSGPSLIANTVIAGNLGAGVMLYNDNVLLRNDILWDNTTPVMLSGGATGNIEHCIVEGGFAGAGNLSVDPMFVDAIGADTLAWSGDEDLSLAPGSPAIDAGDNAGVPMGNVLDLSDSARRHDDPGMPDTGAGAMPIVDIGAYEFGAPPPCAAADVAFPFGVLDFSDVLAFITAVNAGDPSADIAEPFGQVDITDVFEFLIQFSAGCP